MKFLPWIIIAAAVVAGVWYFKFRKPSMSPADAANYANALKGQTVIPQTPIRAAVTGYPVSVGYAPPPQAGTGGVNTIQKISGTVGTLAQAGCAAAGGGPLCGIAGNVAGAVTGAATQGAVSIAKAGVSLISNLKFW